MPSDPVDDVQLRVTIRPDFETGPRVLRSADLFSGCGGLTLGLAQACLDGGIALDIRLAVDSDPDAIAVYKANFPKACACFSDIHEFFDGALGAPPSPSEVATRKNIGDVDVVVAGPPCQGHSDLNNHTRRNDPRNLLYLRVVRAIEILRPKAVVVENVPTVQHDLNRVVETASAHLESLGFRVADRSIRVDALGVPQLRRRHVLLGLAQTIDASPLTILEVVAARRSESRNLRWAIGDLANIENPTGLDIAPRASATNIARMEWLLSHGEYNLPNSLRPKCHQDSNHSYHSMYGRLNWNAPAQTITSGFGSVGQGRYMHPDKPRALTPHEAARIQGIPDYFDFSVSPRREALARMIANAVPPPLGRAIFKELVPILEIDTEQTR